MGNLLSQHISAGTSVFTNIRYQLNVCLFLPVFVKVVFPLVALPVRQLIFREPWRNNKKTGEEDRMRHSGSVSRTDIWWSYGNSEPVPIHSHSKYYSVLVTIFFSFLKSMTHARQMLSHRYLLERVFLQMSTIVPAGWIVRGWVCLV